MVMKYKLDVIVVSSGNEGEFQDECWIKILGTLPSRQQSSRRI